MNEQTMQYELAAVLEDAADWLSHDEDIQPPAALGAIDSIRTFEDAGILTTNKGLVIRMKDRSEFQMTIVKSK